MNCKVGTIRQVHGRLTQEGYQISECALRKWIKEGRLPAVYTGNKALISFEKVVELLEGVPSTVPSTATS